MQTRHFTEYLRLSCLVAVLSTLALSPALAQAPAEQGSGIPAEQDSGLSNDAVPTIVVTDDGNTRSQVRLAFPPATYDPSLDGTYLEAAKEVERALREDFEQMVVFNAQGPTELSVLTLTGQREHDFAQYRSLGNEIVLLATLRREDDRVLLDGWVYDLPSQQSVLGKRFRGTRDQARLVAHYLADAMHFQFTGRPSLALTTIAFHSNRDGNQELYLMDYDGYNQRQISRHTSTSGYSDWSRDGDAIAYMSYYAGTPGIYYVEIDTGRKVTVYRDGTLNLSPSFAPDGQQIAFAHSRSANVDIYTCGRVCNDPQRITQSPAIDTNPAWSPDGQRIAFTSSRSGRPNVYVMDKDGSNVRRISFEGNYNDGAGWRSDGTQLVYASREGNNFRIAVTNLIDLKTTIVASGSGSYEEPSFSPDGDRIVFTAKRNGGSQIFVMDANGSNLRQLTHEGDNAGGSWSWFPQR